MKSSLDTSPGRKAPKVGGMSLVTRNVVVVAPFAPGEPPTHLGAAKKIELVLGLLRRLGFNVHLIDSSHPTRAFVSPVLGQSCIVGSTSITLWRPFCLPSRKLGKLLNVMLSSAFLSKLIHLTPAFVWSYNSYSFEARAALYLKQRTHSKIVLELEDLPLARARSLNPKPRLDQHFFPRLVAAADLVTCVNAALQRQFSIDGKRSLLFPSLLQQALVDAAPSPRFASHTYRVGYFGGLEVEKGAGLLLEAVARLPAHWKLVITGIGSLTTAFTNLQKTESERLEFHGRVAHEEVLSLMQSCDAIVNPHTPISLMRDGVFPFKVCEALATGALLVSTELPSIDIDLSRSSMAFDGSVHGLVEALSAAPAFYAENLGSIRQTRAEVCARFSEKSMCESLRTELNALFTG